MRRILAVLALAVAALAQPTATAQPGSAGLVKHSDVAYVSKGNAQQVLDLWVPRSNGRPLPMIVYVHGGGWGAGDKTEIERLPGWQTFMSQGFAIASINYTLSATAPFPQQIYDVKAAVRHLRANAGRYHLNGKVGLWGGSAGGQLVALAGATCGVTPLEGKQGSNRESSCVQAVVDFSGPTDFLEMESHYPPTSPESRYLGCTNGLAECPASTVERANPITYITSSSDLPAYLIAHGAADTLVPLEQSQILYDALAAACAEVALYTLQGQGHFFPATALDPPYPAQSVRQSQGCRPVATPRPPLSWDSVFSFFRAHVR